MFDGWIDIIPICVALKAILVDFFKLFSMQTIEKFNIMVSFTISLTSWICDSIVMCELEQLC
jgi:hypothetical protein